MAILTLKGHVSRALDFYKHDDLYAAIGKPDPWDAGSVKDFVDGTDYDSYPPVPSNTDDLLDAIGYKKAEFKSMVVQDEESGTLEYRGTKWRIVTPEQAIEQGARWVYISTTLRYDELPTNRPYRQVGWYTGLKLADGVEPSKFNLLPEEVEDPGILEILDNRRPVYRDNDVRETIKVVMEF